MLIFLIFNFLDIKGQNFDAHIQNLKNQNFKKLNDGLNNNNLSIIEKTYFSSQINLIKKAKINVAAYNKLKHIKENNSREIALKDLIIGDYHLFKTIPNDSLSLIHYKAALTISLKKKDTILIAESIKKILNQFSQNRSGNILYTKDLKTYKNYLYDNYEKATYYYFKHTFIAVSKNIEQIDSLKKRLHLANNTQNPYLKAKYNQMIGVYFSYFKKENDSALVYMHRAKNFLELKPYQHYKNELFGIYGNIGQYEEKKGNYLIARDYYTKANRIKVPKYRYLVKVKLNEILAENANKRNLKDSAYFYLKQSNLYKDTLNEFNKAKALFDLDKKYQTAEKDKIILETENKRIKNKNFLIATILSLILISIIGALAIKNSDKKRKVAEQQKELEKQKNLTLLKEQEITSINAMIDGQEKERKRIAEDLHDNLGSVLATLKLHFENLKRNKEKKKIDQNTLFDNTEDLIDEAYLKVRSIAHAKNAGVIANQGLLIAIQMMAEKISSADKIKIEVIDFGLNKHLENSLEITIFRIIQELITNVIKHADAKNTTINISLYDKNLNIIIEDDGKGFDIKKVNLKNGMGISSIKTRIAHLKGTFNVDSTLGKGSSVIIDIPVE